LSWELPSVLGLGFALFVLPVRCSAKTLSAYNSPCVKNAPTKVVLSSVLFRLVRPGYVDVLSTTDPIDPLRFPKSFPPLPPLPRELALRAGRIVL